MRFVGLVSGGKDSIYSILECMKNGHELVACVHLGAPDNVEEESYMYQTAGSEVLRTLVEECIGVPLLLHQRVGKSLNVSLVYQETSKNDEVEDLYEALKIAKERYDMEAVSSGAILSTYQRVRVENVCSRLGLTSLSYLWRLKPQKELLQKMLDDGIEAVLVRTACPPGLVPRRHLNKSLRDLSASGLLDRLNQRYQFHMCGEGGEYESLVVDSPIYQRRLILDQVEIVETDDGVGYLKLHTWHSEAKENFELGVPNAKKQSDGEKLSPKNESRSSDRESSKEISLVVLPHVYRGKGGLLHLSEIMAPAPATAESPDESEADLALREALQVFHTLSRTLDFHGGDAQDVAMVHLYLSEMSHFARINRHYLELFGPLLPPSRSCVAIGKGVLPGGRRVMMDCLVQLGSGLYMRSSDKDTNSLVNDYARAALATKTSKLREVLHVQSISHWAPVCVGPYSQVNTLRGAVHFLAGQIGLYPATMKLRDTWEEQAKQCWKNAASVLDALEGCSLDQILSGLIYLHGEIFQQRGSIETLETITLKEVESNGGVVAGAVDAAETQPFGGYEDEGTWQEMQRERGTDAKPPHFLVVSIPEMPVGAKVEIELVASSKAASECLSIFSTYSSRKKSLTDCDKGKVTTWDTGHDFNTMKRSDLCTVDTFAKCIGRACFGSALVTASVSVFDAELLVDYKTVIEHMMESTDLALAELRSGLSSKDIPVLNVRAYYLASEGNAISDDGMRLRHSLAAALSQFSTTRGNALPSWTLVPVMGMSWVPLTGADSKVILAIQITCANFTNMETEMWIRAGRDIGA